MENSLCEKPERHASRKLSDHLTFEGQKQKVHSLVDKVRACYDALRRA
jgi:RNA-directed DNA polymerase